MSSIPEVIVRDEGSVREIHINRPDRKNALTHAMYTAINNALRQGEAETSVRVFLITGTQDCFTAGNDMVDFLQNPPTAEGSPVMLFLDTLANLAKPIVAAVNGPAVGVGTTMLLHCDLVYVGPTAQLKMPFVGLGLCPEAGSSYLLPLMMGQQRAAALLLLGESLGPEKAVQYGLANEQASESDYLGLARTRAAALAVLPPAAVRVSKRFMRQPRQEALLTHMALEGKEFVSRLGSAEAREAMQAFMEKRKPDFSHFD